MPLGGDQGCLSPPQRWMPVPEKADGLLPEHTAVPVIEMCPHDAKSNSGAVWLLAHLSASWSLSLFVCLPIYLSVYSEKIDDVIVNQDDATKVRGEVFNWNVRGWELLRWCD